MTMQGCGTEAVALPSFKAREILPKALYRLIGKGKRH